MTPTSAGAPDPARSRASGLITVIEAQASAAIPLKRSPPAAALPTSRRCSWGVDRPAEILQPGQEGITVALWADHITEHKEGVHPAGGLQIPLNLLIELKVTLESTDEGPAFRQRSHVGGVVGSLGVPKPWLSTSRHLKEPGINSARQVRSMS